MANAHLHHLANINFVSMVSKFPQTRILWGSHCVHVSHGLIMRSWSAAYARNWVNNNTARLFYVTYALGYRSLSI